uniref:RING-type domain-containing protein n=1 Tax=Globisporangium ultimum (strain ATCC 200006 / CBS 805.95 / DAOM BR144) TaxID=431595 RepID=K3WUB1_GLOUD
MAPATVRRILFRALSVALLALVCVAPVHALILESPLSQLLTHVSGEFTNQSVLLEGSVAHHEVVSVSPFHACESLTHMDLTNKVALVVRGECNFVQKVWNAQRANATAVIVMDNELRVEAPFHIIMQKDQHASNIHIPSVFVSYTAGAKILHALRHAPPWSPVRVTLNQHGELPNSKTTNSLLKRIVAYIFLVSVVCVFSSGLSLISSTMFQFIGKRRRTRASRKLPLARYQRDLQRMLLQQLVEEQHVIDHITLDDLGDDEEYDIAFGTIGSHEGCGDAEVCAICLEDFQVGHNVKVLPCQHFYHVECIDPWLERQSSCCPLCKQDAISTDVGAPPKRIFGFAIPRVEQILQHEHVFHTFFLMLPASIVSCLIVNSAASIISSLWP